MTQPRLLGDRYQLDDVVGRGGMAEVYRAHDLRLDRVVAVKTLRVDLARDDVFQARFRREAQSAASLNHPSIVAVYDTGEDLVDGLPVPYIVMEYVAGRTIRDLLVDDRRLLPERGLEIIDGVLRALEYSHRAGIVHRDIKPGNVMVTRSGDIKVMDFGIARAINDAQATMTQTAQVIGTAQYLSPEQARGERVDARSDLYSTGCLLYELMTGRPPFTGDSPVAIAYQHVRENPVPPSVVDPEVPPWADAIVLKAMAKDVTDRYQSAGEMRADTERALSGVPVAAATRMDAYTGTRRMDGPPRTAAATAAIPPYDYATAQTAEDTDDDGRRPHRLRNVLLWLLGILIVLAAIGAVAYYLLVGFGPRYPVPQVDGVPKAQAQREVSAAHLRSAVVDRASSTVTKGDVIDSNPAEGDKVAKNSLVKLYVSSGPKMVTVPDVQGQSQASAQSTLTGDGLKVALKTDNSSTAASGTVVRQSPKPKASVRPGSTVTLYVSGGGVTVPSVTGDPAGSAQSVLQGDGFKVDTKTVAGPSSATPGNVFNQSPSANTTEPSGSTVTIYVAKAAPTVGPSTPAGASPSSPFGASPSAPAGTSPGGASTSGGGSHGSGGHNHGPFDSSSPSGGPSGAGNGHSQR